MKAYITFLRHQIISEEEMSIYREKVIAAAAASAHAPRVLARYGSCETLEGENTVGVVLLEFDSVEAAKAWYFDEGYQDAAAHRKRGSYYTVVLTEGVPAA